LAQEAVVLSIPDERVGDMETMMLATPPPLPLANGDTLMFMQFEMAIPGEIVPGKPYAAELAVEVHQPMVDGNAITVTHRSRLYRDGAGRTRREDELGTDGNRRVTTTLTDPVTGNSYILEPERKFARLLPQAGAESQPFAFFSAAGETPRVPPAERSAPPSNLSPAASLTGLAAATAVPFSAATLITLPFPGEPVTVALGEREIEGVRASGTRTTVTIPASAIGNRQPIEIVTEQWYSAELDVIVSSEHRDPRVGETRYRLERIQRGEPDAALFEVPADFTVTAPGATSGELIAR
jgi:hypothetical protein